MMDSYGLPYQGSKNKIAEFIISNLPRAEHFYDLFAGGCAITHCALVSGKYNHIHANDIQVKYPQLFYDAAHGKYKNENRVITRDEFFRFKDTDALVELCWSFGNGKTTYIFGKNIEDVKIAACNVIMCDDKHKRRLYYREFIRKLLPNITNYEKVTLLQLQSLESIDRIEKLEQLEQLVQLERLEISGKSYDDVDILPNSVVYCDPPYIGTKGYGVDFDHNKFYQWLRSTTFPVYISEYTMPSDFMPIATVDKVATFSATNKSAIKQENLYLHERFYTGKK